MLLKLGIEEKKVPELCFSLYKDYGTTMAGLRVCYGRSILFQKLFLKMCNVEQVDNEFLFLFFRLLDITLIMMTSMGTNLSLSLSLSLSSNRKNYNFFHLLLFPL